MRILQQAWASNGRRMETTPGAEMVIRVDIEIIYDELTAEVSKEAAAGLKGFPSTLRNIKMTKTQDKDTLISLITDTGFKKTDWRRCWCGSLYTAFRRLGDY